MNISEFKPPNDIEKYYVEKQMLSRNLAKKIDLIQEDIKQGKRKIDIAFYRIWANCNKAFNDLNIYNMYKYKTYYDILISYKTEIIKAKTVNKKDLEKCELMICAISDLFEIIYEIWQKINLFCDTIFKGCDNLEQDKSISGEIINTVNIQKTIDQLLGFESEVQEYESKNLKPIMDEVIEYIENIKRKRYQFGG